MEISCWEVQKYTVLVFWRDGKRGRRHFYTEEAALEYLKQVAETCMSFSLTMTKLARFM